MLCQRFADSSSFLVDSAERALQQMMDGVSPSRSLAGLLTAAEHRTACVRGKVASLLYLLWYQRVRELRLSCIAGGKEQETLKMKISKLISDQTPEARTASRNIVRFLLREGVVTRCEWEQHMTADQLDKILSQSMSAPTAIGGSSGSGSGSGSLTEAKIGRAHV